MTTDHVALAIMHGTTPEQEAGTEPKAPVAKNSKRYFEMPETRSERAEKAKAVAEKLLKGKTVKGGFKIGACADMTVKKKYVDLFFALTDETGAEPFGMFSYATGSPDLDENGILKALCDAEKSKELADTGLTVYCRYKSEYWAAPKRKKAEQKVDAPATANDKKDAGKKTGKKREVVASF